MGQIEDRLAQWNIALPKAASPVANYVPCVQSGNLLYVSGQLPFEHGEVAVTGHLGEDVGLEDGQRAARLCALNILAQAQSALGSLDRVVRVVRLGGFVACTPHFTQQPEVVNGASNTMVEILGDAGKHARAAVGVASLPRGAAVEVDAIIEIKLEI